MVIKVFDIAGGADTEKHGEIVLRALRGALASTRDITLSFEGVTTATSSFVNAGLVPLLEGMSLNDIKARIKFTRSGKQINDMIRSRLTREANSVAA